MASTRLPTLLVPLRNRLQLFEVYYHRDGQSGLFIAGAADFAVGDALYVELNFLEEQRAFRLKGTVRWRRLHSGRSSLPPGLGVEFDDDERRTRDLVLDFARGREVEFTVRAAHRLPVAIQIAYASDARFLTDVSDDLSAGGLFIATDAPLDVGTVLELKLRPPGHLLGLRLRGSVAWVARRGVRRGMGIRFLFDSERQQRQIEAVVAKLRKRLLRDLRIQVSRG